MGIPKLFSQWIKKHKIYNSYEEGNQLKILKPILSLKNGLISFDLNGIIHQSYENIYKKIENDEIKFYEINNYNLIINEVINLLFKFINLINNKSKYLWDFYIAIDGIAPTSKANQQRERRYQSDDIMRSNISPGTIFMYKLELEIKKMIKVKFFNEIINEYYIEFNNDCAEQRNCDNEQKIYFIGSNFVGEGEHKIMKILNEKNYDNVLIHGLDTDILIRSMIHHSNIDFYLYHQNKEKYQMDTLINVKYIFNYYLNLFQKTKLKNLSKIFYKNLFFILLLPIGNDFLPKFLTLSYTMDINIFIFNLNKRIKIKELNEFIYNIENFPEDKTGLLIKKVVLFVYNKLVPNSELNFLKHKYTVLNENSPLFKVLNIYLSNDDNIKTFQNKWYSDVEIVDNNFTTRGFNIDLIKILDNNFNKIKSLKVSSNNNNLNTYSNFKLNEIYVQQFIIDKMCLLYLENIQWNSQYYFLKNHNVFDTIFYPYHKSPLLINLNDFNNESNLIIPKLHKEFIKGNEIIKLKMISNPKSNLVKNIKLRFDEINYDLFPEDFKKSNLLSRVDYDISSILPNTYLERF